MLFGRLRIRGKLALLVLVPLLGVVALSVPIVTNRIDTARAAQKISETVRLASRVGSAVQEMQEERLLSIGYLFGLIEQPELVLQSAQTTDAIIAIDQGSEAISPKLRQAITDTAKLNSTRQKIADRTLRPDLVVSEFTGAISPLIDGLGLADEADLRTAVGRQVFALEQTLRSDDLISQASSYLTAATITKNGGLVTLFTSTVVQIQQAIQSAQPYFADAQYQLYLGAREAFSARVGDDFLALAGRDPQTAINQLDIRMLFPSLRSVQVLGGFVEKRVAADVNVTVNDSRNRALRDAMGLGGGALLLLLVVVLLSVLLARAVARPLRRLTISANRIARAAKTELERVADDDADLVRPIRLDPVDVQAYDEIGDLARAFDQVQTTAARLVERQVLSRRNVAQMFGHVGRRTQNLVGRQLNLIDRLEREETDSARLGELYRLDHLSSRLRRNASSLVVLSGGGGADEHITPMLLADVVRLALGEIEDYTRVDLDLPEDITVVPALPADLTLLLAELMENATSFSPPHTRVTVNATELRGGGARLAVIDHGLGLTPERLAEENARLGRRERLDLAPTEVLGLFVVGRLARRHSIEVTLANSPGGGTTAWVDLPAAQLIAPVGGQTTTSIVPVSSGAPALGAGEFALAIAGSAARSAVPGSLQPFDAHALYRATKTLETTPSWNAFAPALESAPLVLPIRSASADFDADADEPADGGYATNPGYPNRQGYPDNPGYSDHLRYAEPGYPEPVYDAEPVYEAEPIYDAEPVFSPPPANQAPTHPAPAYRPAAYQPPYQAPAYPEPAYAKQVPAAPYDFGEPVAGRFPTTAAPTDQPPARRRPIIQQRSASQLESRELTSDQPAGPAPLARRVPGATRPDDEPQPAPPRKSALPLDPEEARALIQQFEYGVALALNEIQPQPEGQSR